MTANTGSTRSATSIRSSFLPVLTRALGLCARQRKLVPARGGNARSLPAPASAFGQGNLPAMVGGRGIRRAQAVEGQKPVAFDLCCCASLPYPPQGPPLVTGCD